MSRVPQYPQVYLVYIIDASIRGVYLLKECRDSRAASCSARLSMADFVCSPSFGSMLEVALVGTRTPWGSKPGAIL